MSFFFNKYSRKTDLIKQILMFYLIAYFTIHKLKLFKILLDIFIKSSKTHYDNCLYTIIYNLNFNNTMLFMFDPNEYQL